VNLGSHNALGGREMNDIASEFERLLGNAALTLWPDLPRDVQELLFETAQPTCMTRYLSMLLLRA
jgi:hypothetical protein